VVGDGYGSALGARHSGRAVFELLAARIARVSTGPSSTNVPAASDVLQSGTTGTEKVVAVLASFGDVPCIRSRRWTPICLGLSERDRILFDSCRMFHVDMLGGFRTAAFM
jgi:hypothetical protein